MAGKNREERLRFLLETDLPFRNLGIVAGMDEVGRGPLAGNVVTACVVMPEDSRNMIRLGHTIGLFSHTTSTMTLPL